MIGLPPALARFTFGTRRLIGFAVPLVLLALLWPHAWGQAPTKADDRSDAHSAGRVRVVFGGDSAYAPFAFVDAAGKPEGFDVELFKAVAQYSGLSTEYRMGNRESLVAGLSSGQIDVVPMLVSESRSERFLFSEPLVSRHYRAFGHENADFIPSLHALGGRRVASVRAGLAWEELRKMEGITLVGTATEGDALRAVALGRADYALVELLVGQTTLQRIGLTRIVPLSPPLLRSDYAFAITRNRPELLGQINAGLQEATRRGDWSRIQLRWLANLTPPEQAYRSGLWRGLWFGVPVLLMAVALLWLWRRAGRRANVEALMRQQSESTRKELELQDPVTHLPNRQAFRQALGELIAAGQPFSLIRVDLLDMDSVETIAGDAFVDELLAEIGARLRASCERGLIAKVGYSGFLVARPGVADTAGARHAMHFLREVTSHGSIRGIALEQGCSVGAALYPEHALDADELMRAASAASAASRHLPDGMAVYAKALAPDPMNLTLLGELRQAVREQEIAYALQPKLDLKTRRVTGAEMLVRWNHPRHGLLLPPAFVPLAEQRGVIGEMTLHLVARALEQCREWRRYCPEFTISVNISANDLCEAEVVGQIARLSEGMTDALILEVTETAVMKDPAAAFEAVLRLRSSGLRISLDDFGTGHASLIYLRRLAPHEVKVDRAFVTGVRASNADEQIVRSIIQLSHSLGALVVAEGVEDPNTLEWLASAGCDYAQGYWVGRPLKPDDLFDRLQATGWQLPRMTSCNTQPHQAGALAMLRVAGAPKV